MKRISRVSMAIIGGLLCLLAIHGCGGDGGDGGNDDGGRPQTTASQKTNDAVNRALRALLRETPEGNAGTQGEAITSQEPVNLTMPCSNTGNISLVGEINPAGNQSAILVGTFTYANCDGIDGDLTVEALFVVGSNRITMDITLDGSLRVDGCVITFDLLTISTSINRSSGAIDVPILLDGTIRATCGGDSAICRLDNVDIEDRQAFEDSCVSN